MKNFKVKDLMITISPEKHDRNGVYNCEHKSKGDTVCTQCTHRTTGTTKPNCFAKSKKPNHESRTKDSVKAAELAKLKRAVAELQEKEYA